MSQQDYNPFDDLPDLEDKVILQRLAVLGVICVCIGFGGFWLMQTHLLNMFSRIGSIIAEYWDIIGTAVFWKGLFTWVRAMWFRWLFVEVPKRIFLYTILPNVILRLIPPRFYRRQRMRLRYGLARMLAFKDWVMLWGKRWFGDRVGWAFGMIVLAFVFFIFYFFFGAWLIIWIGIIKFPNWLLGLFRGIGNFVFKKLQIGTFAKFMFSQINRFLNPFRELFLVILARLSPRLAKRLRERKTDEDRRREARSRARKAIRDRQHLKLFYEVRGSWSEYKRRRRQQMRERIKRKRYWQGVRREEKWGSVVRNLKNPVGVPCCQDSVAETPLETAAE